MLKISIKFAHRWGKIRMLLPYQPDYKQDQLKVPGTGVCAAGTCNGQHSHQVTSMTVNVEINCSLYCHIKSHSLSYQLFCFSIMIRNFFPAFNLAFNSLSITLFRYFRLMKLRISNLFSTTLLSLIDLSHHLSKLNYGRMT